MERSPAFQFYPADWLDFKVLRMTLAAQGAYIRLLCHMWRDSKDQCSIPRNIDHIARLLSIGKEEAQSILVQIQWPGDPIFIDRKDRYTSKRLQRVKAQQVKNRKQHSEAGSEGAAKRWRGHAPAKVSPMANDSSSSSSSPSSSSSSSSSPAKEEGGGTPPSPNDPTLQVYVQTWIEARPEHKGKEPWLMKHLRPLLDARMPPDVAQRHLKDRKYTEPWDVVKAAFATALTAPVEPTRMTPMMAAQIEKDRIRWAKEEADAKRT